MQATMQITFREFCAGDAEAFRALNEQWIAKYFGFEEADLKVLADPEKHILQPGGRIYFATLDGEIAGCCALIVNGEQSYELAKMAVREDLRNQGIGKALLVYVIDAARSLRARKLTLGTNSKLTNAIHLYESMGFQPLDPAKLEPSPYKRADVFMEMLL